MLLCNSLNNTTLRVNHAAERPPVRSEMLLKHSCLSLHSSTVSTKVKSNVNQLKGMRVSAPREHSQTAQKKKQKRKINKMAG